MRSVGLIFGLFSYLFAPADALAAESHGVPAAELPTNDMVFIAPVQGTVVDGFRPPQTPYGPGNVGLEYSTEPGRPVVASLGGRVRFAGQVAGQLFVTVEHSNGFISTYGLLADIKVSPGDSVAGGELIGTAGSHTFFSVRQYGVYLDPAQLLDDHQAVHLVPVSGADGGAREKSDSISGVPQGTSESQGAGSSDVAIAWLRASTPGNVVAADPAFPPASPAAPGHLVRASAVLAPTMAKSTSSVKNTFTGRGAVAFMIAVPVMLAAFWFRSRFSQT